MATAQEYTDNYLDLDKDIKNVDKVTFFDDLRKETTKAQHEAAMRTKDPAKKHEQLSELYNRLRQDIAYFAGNDPAAAPSRPVSPLEERIRKGLAAIEEKL